MLRIFIEGAIFPEAAASAAEPLAPSGAIMTQFQLPEGLLAVFATSRLIVCYAASDIAVGLGRYSRFRCSSPFQDELTMSHAAWRRRVSSILSSRAARHAAPYAYRRRV